ncbi:MAG: hypothetical protein LBS27_06500 [Bifidobacteriaceae bacterium]|jgi:hypothetical protein|nr:hypothetical protein [Bifidobacteriaceae bacterium]
MTPLFSVVRGAATAEELAALTASFAVLAGRTGSLAVSDAVRSPVRPSAGGVGAGLAPAGGNASAGASAWTRREPSWQAPVRLELWAVP